MNSNPCFPKTWTNPALICRNGLAAAAYTQKQKLGLRVSCRRRDPQPRRVEKRLSLCASSSTDSKSLFDGHLSADSRCLGCVSGVFEISGMSPQPVEYRYVELLLTLHLSVVAICCGNFEDCFMWGKGRTLPRIQTE